MPLGYALSDYTKIRYALRFWFPCIRSGALEDLVGWKKTTGNFVTRCPRWGYLGLLYLWGKLLDFAISPSFRITKSKVVFLHCSLQQAQTKNNNPQHQQPYRCTSFTVQGWAFCGFWLSWTHINLYRTESLGKVWFTHVIYGLIQLSKVRALFLLSSLQRISTSLLHTRGPRHFALIG